MVFTPQLSSLSLIHFGDGPIFTSVILQPMYLVHKSLFFISTKFFSVYFIFLSVGKVGIFCNFAAISLATPQ